MFIFKAIYGRVVSSFHSLLYAQCGVAVPYVCASTHSAITFNWPERNRILNKENFHASDERVRGELSSICSGPFCWAHTVHALGVVNFQNKIKKIIRT